MKALKQLLLLKFLLIIALNGNAQPVNDYGQLHVEGTQLCDSADNPVILRGMSYSWHNWWPRFYNAETVDWLYNDWKCSVVRAALGVEPVGGYLTDSAGGMDKMKAVIEGAIETGIYVLVDWHSHHLNTEEAKSFFAYMAETYGDYPNIIYEIVNEPDDTESWEDTKAYSIELINTIRAIDEDNIILVGSPHWDQDIDEVADDPVLGYDNIMYTVHFYSATHGQWLRDRCDYALEKGIPIFVSECAGMFANGDGAIDYEEWNDWLIWMENNMISWINWGIADKNESSSVLYGSADSAGGWIEDDLKEWGIYSRNLLRRFYYSYEPGRIYNAMAKGRRGEDLTIGVIGGSITAGYAASTESRRWANLMADWWEEKFPESNVQLINAGWGGTGSDIGVHRVYDDLLVNDPDFVVMEFAVNDITGTHATKMMEGLIQQLIIAENTPGIMMLLLKEESGTSAQESHKLVGNYYEIPMVSFADLIDEQLINDGVNISDIFVDGLHPNDLGMEYIANFLKDALDTIYQDLPEDGDIPEPNNILTKPLITDIYSHTFQFNEDNIIPVMNTGWNIGESGWNTETVGNQIDFRLQGNAVSVLYTKNDNTDRGKAEVWVDEGPKTILDAHFYEDWGTKTSFCLVDENLEDGEHVLHVKVIEDSETGGHYFHLARVLVAGDIGSAPPIALTDGYQKGLVGTTLFLDGTDSFDPDGEKIGSYLWTIDEKPAGSIAVIENPNDSIAGISPDKAGEYIISLVVAAGFNQSLPVKKRLKIVATNAAPVAVAGNDTMSATNKYFTFNGSGSYDNDGDMLSYKWEMESKPEGSFSYLLIDNIATPQCKFDKEGDYVISLIVNDSIVDSEKDYITITALNGYTGLNDVNMEFFPLNIFPNPSDGIFAIKGLPLLSGKICLEIFNFSGIKIADLEVNNSQTHDYTVNLGERAINPGMYLIKLSSNKKSFTGKIIIN